MIELISFVWFCALFFAVMGFLRGWNEELVVTAGVVLMMFALFQFDGILRSTIFLVMPPGQIFLIQAAVFLGVVVFIYRTPHLAGAEDRDPNDYSAGFLGALLGFVNGYLIGGTLWYFLDVNEYPMAQFVTAPAVDSASGQAINLIPLVILGGGASGSGDLLAVGVLILVFIALVTV